MAKKIRIQAELDDSKLRKQLDDIGKRKEKITVNIDSGNIGNVDQSMKGLNRTVSDSNSVFGRLKNTISNTFSNGKIAMTGYLMVLNEINKAGKNAKQTIQEIDKAITDLSVATNMSRESVMGLIRDYNTYAKQLSSTTTQITSAADDYLRAGKSMSETQALIKDSIMLSKLGQIESGAATEDLLAVMNGYEMSIEEVGRALDAMVAIDMKAATSAGDIATALKYCASSADVAGLSFDKLAAMIATTQEKTMQSAETIGTFMNTILSRYRNVKIGQFVSDDGEDLSEVETILNSLNIKLRNSSQEFRDFEKVIEEVAQSWDGYSSVQQAAIAKAFSGTRQQNRFLALMEGYNKTLELTEVAATSAGTAIDKFNNSYMESLEAKQNTLQASFESMIMNTDFSEVYGGILDATTALIDFINQTNALKGAATGIAVTGMVKAFLAVKTGISEAYIALNKYGNALNIVKQTKISTQDFERLLLLTNSLSANQMKLILTSKNLTAEQKMQIVTNAALSEEEKALMIQTYGLTAANTGLTAATTTLGNSLKALFATLVTNPLIVVTAAVSAAVMAYQSYNQKLEETRQANIDNATAASEHADELKKLYDEYTRLASIQDRTTSEEEAFKTAVENITVALGDKAEVLENLTAGTDEYADALARATKEELQSQAVTATIGRKSAEEDLQGDIWSKWSGSQVAIDSNSKGKSLSNEAQKAVAIVSDSLKEYETINRTWKNISWDITSDDPTEALEYYNSLIEAREKLVLASEDDESLLDTEIYKDLNTAINSMSESLDTYIEKLYEEEKLNYMAQNGIPSVTEEYKAMESALVSAAGSSVDLQNRFKELLTEDFSSLATDINSVGEAESDVVAQIPATISSSIQKIATQLEPQFAKLADAYTEIFKVDDNGKEKFNRSAVDNSMLEDIRQSFAEIKDEIGVAFDASKLEPLFDTLTNGDSTAKEVKQAFNELATAYLYSTDTLDQLNDQTADAIEKQLEEMGVQNAAEIVAEALTAKTEELIVAKEYLAKTGKDLSSATEEERTAFILEQIEAGNCGEALALLQLKKMLVNQSTITTAADCQNILALAQAANIGIQQLQQLQTLMNMITQRDSAVASGDSRAVSELNRAIREFSANVVNNLNLEDIEVDFGGGKSGASKAGKKAGDAYVDAFEKELKKLQTLRDQGKITEKQYLDYLRKLYQRFFRDKKKYAEQYAKYEHEYLQGMKSLYESALSGITSMLDKQISAYEDSKSAAVESLEAQRDAAIEAKEAEKERYEQEIELIDKQIAAKEKAIQKIRDEIDAMETANADRKMALNLQLDEYNLQRQLNQKTKLIYTEDGFKFGIDTSGLREAKQKVEDDKLEIEISKKEKKIKLVEKEIDLLNEKKNGINENIDLLDKQIDQINDYYDKLISDTEKYWDNLISGMQEYKSRWEELGEIGENAKLISTLKQLGIEVDDVLGMSEEAFSKFKDEYIGILADIYSGNDSMLSALSDTTGKSVDQMGSYLDSTQGYIDSLSGMGDSLNPLADSIGNVEESMGTLSTTASEADENISSAAGSVDSVNSSLGETASTTDTVATNVGTVVDGLNQLPENGKVSGLAKEFDTLAESIGKVAESLGVSEGQTVGTLFQAMTNLNTVTLGNEGEGIIGQFTLLKNAITDVIETIGSTEAQTVGSLMSAITQLNSISLDESIIAQFTNLKTAIDQVTAAISGGGGESSEGASSGGASGSKGGKQGGSGGKGSEGESGGGNSLTGAIKEMGETAKEVIGEPDAEGDGTVIGEFGSMETAVNDVRDAIGTEGSEGQGGGSGSGGETDDTLVGSIEYLGDKTDEEMGESDGDGIIGKFNEFKDVIEEAANQVKSISEGLDEIDGKEVECTITVNVKMNGSIPAFASGTVLGNMQIESATYNAQYGKAFASGTIGLPKAEKNALVSEYGQTEMTVLPDGKTIITDTPTLMNLPKDTVIYNEEETKKIMDNKVDVSGNAHADGTDDSIWTTLADGTRVRELQPGDRMYDMMQKFDAYFNSMDGNLEKLVPNSVYERNREMNKLADQISYVSSVVNNNRNLQQPIVNNINVTCPGVTEQQVAERIGSVLDKELDKQFSGFHNYVDQRSRMR